jgi:hypothetical protein
MVFAVILPCRIIKPMVGDRDDVKPQDSPSKEVDMSISSARNWKDIGEWGEGMNEYKLPATDELVGKELKFYYNVSNQVIKYVFHNASSLRWEVQEGPDGDQYGDEKYEAIKVAPNIFFVDFVRKNFPYVSVSMALDLGTRRATIVLATAPDKKSASRSFINKLGRGLDLSAIKVEILHANVNPPSPYEPIVPHERTADLIGKRIKYTYSHQHTYEHIYLNEHFYTWQCLAGVEKGLADTDICDYFRIAPDIYLFSWREKIMPTFGLVIINLKDMRSNGKTYGLDLATNKIMNFTMGSIAELINETIYSQSR